MKFKLLSPLITCLYFDSDLKSNFFYLSVPTNDGWIPIATFVTLGSSVTDTVTYSFGPNRFKYFPDKIYYNKKLVWDAANIPHGDAVLPPIIVDK